MLRLLIISVVAVWRISAYPSGPPEEACQFMIPNHSGDAQDLSAAPFVLAVTSDSMKAGESMEVILRGNTNEDKFKGFLVKAQDNDGNTVGKMRPYHGYSEPYVQNKCNGKAIAHNQKWANEPWHRLEFNWDAPADFDGEVEFYATVVQSYDTYWVKLPGSKKVTVAAAAASNTTSNTTKTPGEETVEVRPGGEESEVGKTTDDTGKAISTEEIEEGTILETTDETGNGISDGNSTTPEYDSTTDSDTRASTGTVERINSYILSGLAIIALYVLRH